MKRIIYYIILIAILPLSCKIDNYDVPSSMLEGQIVNSDGKGLQLEQGSTSMRIKMEELSWSETPVPFYLNVKQDGSYINTKIFNGKYAITPVEGPFYPVASETVELNKSLVHNFIVTPYLNVSWIGEPNADADKRITVKFKFTRNSNPIQGGTIPNVQDYRLFISTNRYVGNNNFDENASSIISANNTMENQEITVVSKTTMKYSTTYYIRVGVRVSDSFKKYNYTDIKAITIP